MTITDAPDAAAAAALYAADDFAGTERACAALLERDPTNAAGLHLLAKLAIRAREWDRAGPLVAAALAAAPTDAEVRSTLGGLHTEIGCLGPAVDAFREALALAPDQVQAQAHVDLGVALRRAGRLSEAAECFETVTRLAPDNPRAHLLLFEVLHMHGDLTRGWREYEWRLPASPPTATYPQPQWDGTRLDGRTILIVAEQGLGDQIQFARYAHFVKQLGAQVLLKCHGSLVRLLRTCHGVDEVFGNPDELPPFDTWAFSGSLPRLLEPVLDSIPNAVPYVFADAPQALRWRKLLQAHRGVLKVGINWEGNRNNVAGRGREVPLAQMLRLGRVPGVQLFSLQTGAGSDDLPPATADVRVPNLGKFFVDMANTAAAIVELDLVVTNDTSIAHLAGALGRPVWVVLPPYPCWRYGHAGDATPWYPSMRLFRHAPGEHGWDGVLERVTIALTDYARRCMSDQSVRVVA